MSTTRARRNSPRLFACASLRTDAATPSPRIPCTTKLMLQRFGSACRSTSSAAASGTRRLNASTEQVGGHGWIAPEVGIRSGRGPAPASLVVGSGSVGPRSSSFLLTSQAG